VVNPSVKLKDKGVKAGIPVMSGARGDARVKEPVISQVGGQLVSKNVVNGNPV
jgi:hypothetical protein